jgi:hypothetical protein
MIHVAPDISVRSQVKDEVLTGDRVTQARFVAAVARPERDMVRYPVRVSSRQIVEDADLRSELDQFCDEVRADESAATGDEYALA